MPIDARSTEVDAGDMGLKVDVTPGNTLKPLPPNQMDPALREVDDMLSAAISKSSVANILQGGDVAPGTAFATLNLATQTAVGALKPAKELAEYALADIFTLFLLWANYTQNSIDGYGTGKADLGEGYSIEWDEITPESIYLSVELKPDVPLDRMQRANTAMMMVNSGIYSKARALDEMGVTDPETVQKEIYFDMLLDAQMQNLIQTQQAQSQMALQMEQQAAQQMSLEANQTDLAGAPGGQGFDPNQGGVPPQMVAPGATREGVTGMDMEGNPTTMGMGGL
jgi:hypothetical protein